MKLYYTAKWRGREIQFYGIGEDKYKVKNLLPSLGKLLLSQINNEKIEVILRFEKMSKIRRAWDTLSSKKFSDNPLGYVLRREVNSNINRVYINVFKIVEIATQESNSLIFLKQQLYETILHEEAHLFHFRENKIFESMKIIRGRIWVAVDKLNEMTVIEDELLQQNHKKALLNLRKMLITILEKIIYEGFAIFAEEIQGNYTNYNKVVAKNLYVEAKEEAIQLNAYLESTYNLFKKGLLETDTKKRNIAMSKYENILSNIIECSEEIGYHFYYVIFGEYLKKYMLETIVKMDIHKLFKLYEAACMKQGIKPVVSMYTENGIFSYRKHVNQLGKLSKEFA